MNSRQLAAAAVLCTIVGYTAYAQGGAGSKTPNPATASHSKAKVIKTEAEWKRLLTPEQFNVTRQKGTERAFTGKYDHFKGKGIYQCASCGNELFRSDTKFDSGTGWPSFWKPLGAESIRTEADEDRTEVLCRRCDAHLGHVFDDGPKPTGLRYCMNSVAMKFVKSPVKTK